MKRNIVIVENKAERRYYGGGDGKAINHYSERQYISNTGHEFYVNRQLDCDPRCYDIDYCLEGVALFKRLKVAGKEYFGSGLSWEKAEALAIPEMIKFVADDCYRQWTENEQQRQQEE